MPNKPKRTPPRRLQVLRTQSLTPHLKRITLGGDQLHGFPEDSYGAHIKVFIPQDHQTQLHLPTLSNQGIVWPCLEDKPITRTYTVREYRPIENELDVEFVLHGFGNQNQAGPASAWANNAKPGDHIGIAGPGGPTPLLANADWHLLAGDLSALPAISAILSTLPEHALGHVFIEVDHTDNCIPILHPPGIFIHWLIQQSEQGILLSAIKTVAPPIGTRSISAFIAGENKAVVGIRDYLREAYSLTKRNLYAVPYWRRGQDEERYHQQRHQIMDEVY